MNGMKIIYEPRELILELTELVNSGHVEAGAVMKYIGELNQPLTEDKELLVKDEGVVMVKNSDYFGKRRIVATMKGEGPAFYL